MCNDIQTIATLFVIFFACFIWIAVSEYCDPIIFRSQNFKKRFKRIKDRATRYC